MKNQLENNHKDLTMLEKLKNRSNGKDKKIKDLSEGFEFMDNQKEKEDKLNTQLEDEIKRLKKENLKYSIKIHRLLRTDALLIEILSKEKSKQELGVINKKIKRIVNKEIKEKYQTAS